MFFIKLKKKDSSLFRISAWIPTYLKFSGICYETSMFQTGKNISKSVFFLKSKFLISF